MAPAPSLPYSYSKDDKIKKQLRPSFASPTPPLSLPQRRQIYILALLCLLVGAVGIVLSVSALRRPPRTVTVYRCGRSEDTLRTFHSRSGAVGGAAARPKLLGFVGVQTGFDSADRRAALRSTWFPSDPEGLLNLERATGLAFRLAFYKAAFSLFYAEFYVKADDDIYMRPDRLATLLAKDRAHHLTYIGCMKKGPVVTDPKMKWYESSGHLIGNEYFLHAYGPIYALSAEVVAALATARNDRGADKIADSVHG